MIQVVVREPQTPAPPAPPSPEPVIVTLPREFPPTPPPWMTLPPQVTLLIALGFFAACAVILHPLMRAFARRIEGRPAADPGFKNELEQLQSRVSQVESVQGRVLELEERVDFAERLLAQRRDPERLERGQV